MSELADVAQKVGTVSPLEVLVFAERWGQPHLPYPFTGHTGEMTFEQIDRQRREILDRIETSPPRQFEEWARTSIAPDLRVEVVADVRRGDPSGESLRINAVRRNDFGFVATQTVFTDGTASGDIDVYALPAVEVARGIVAALPEPTRSVSLGDVFPRTPEADGSVVSTDGATDRDDPNRRLGEATPLRGGFLQVRDGVNGERWLDPKQPRMLWTDFETFGRYTLADGGALALDAASMERRINSMIGAVVHRIRERRGG